MTRERLYEVVITIAAVALLICFIIYGLDLNDPGLWWWVAFGVAIGAIKAV